MAEVTVTAVRTFTFRGEIVNKGSDVTMEAVHAAIEARNGNVSLAKGHAKYMTATATPEPTEPPPTRRSRRQYRRRDMTAESS